MNETVYNLDSIRNRLEQMEEDHASTLEDKEKAEKKVLVMMTSTIVPEIRWLLEHLRRATGTATFASGTHAKDIDAWTKKLEIRLAPSIEIGKFVRLGLHEVVRNMRYLIDQIDNAVDSVPVKPEPATAQ
jgi:hypothetical protein